MNAIPELGIGIVYLRQFEPFLEKYSGFLQVVELEPQTLWYETQSREAFGIDSRAGSFLKSLNRPLLFHGVGAPVAGSQQPPARMIRTLIEHSSALNPLAFSEHLSFNSFIENGKRTNTNFLLPPLQTEQGLKVILRNIDCYRNSLALPFAFETGVNYLKPLAGEMEDGRFVCEVAERADCSILLDLHNVLANHKNGRQPIREFLAQLPHARISELHLANGFFHKGYYLDAHSGAMSEELLDISLKVVKSLPDLKAIIFEMLPEYIDEVPEAKLRQQLSAMQRIWDARGRSNKTKTVAARPTVQGTISQKDWEQELGRRVLHRSTDSTGWAEVLASDKGLDVIRELIYLFRGSALVTNLQLSTRLLRLTIGEVAFKDFLSTFFDSSVPELFPYRAALQFAEFIKGKYDIRYLDGMLAYEIAGIRVRSGGRNRKVFFNFNPFPVIRSLTDAELPKEQDIPMKFLITITKDDEMSSGELLKLNAVFHS